jgi:hypothetical protein
VNAPGRLGLYGAGLVAVFGGAFALASAVVPDSLVESWKDEAVTQHPATDDDQHDGVHGSDH